ncbi:MAG: pseudouridine synthase [Chlamydiota bacterium]
MQRLSKIISRAGVCSRRAAEVLITEGRVSVAGKCILRPEHHVDPEEAILVNGKPLPSSPRSVVYLLHKPRGFVCSNARTSPKQKLVFDLLPPGQGRLFTVGRLDKDTEGLILVTNNGFFTQIIHPSRNLEREYILKAAEIIQPQHLLSLRKPLYIERKRILAKIVKKIRRNTCSITVTDGKKHEVRLLAKRAGLEVLTLKRIRLGNLRLGNLPKGSYKRLSPKELASISPLLKDFSW